MKLRPMGVEKIANMKFSVGEKCSIASSMQYRVENLNHSEIERNDIHPIIFLLNRRKPIILEKIQKISLFLFVMYFY